MKKEINQFIITSFDVIYLSPRDMWWLQKEEKEKKSGPQISQWKNNYNKVIIITQSDVSGEGFFWERQSYLFEMWLWELFRVLKLFCCNLGGKNPRKKNLNGGIGLPCVKDGVKIHIVLEEKKTAGQNRRITFRLYRKSTFVA